MLLKLSGEFLAVRLKVSDEHVDYLIEEIKNVAERESNLVL